MWPRNEARMDNNLFQLFTSCPSEVKADAAMFEDTKLYCVKQNMRKENKQMRRFGWNTEAVARKWRSYFCGINSSASWQKKNLSLNTEPLRQDVSGSLTVRLLSPAARGALQLGALPQRVGSHGAEERPGCSRNSHCGNAPTKTDNQLHDAPELLFYASAGVCWATSEVWEYYCRFPRQVRRPTRHSTTSSTTWAASDMLVCLQFAIWPVCIELYWILIQTRQDCQSHDDLAYTSKKEWEEEQTYLIPPHLHKS